MDLAGGSNLGEAFNFSCNTRVQPQFWEAKPNFNSVNNPFSLKNQHQKHYLLQSLAACSCTQTQEGVAANTSKRHCPKSYLL